MALSETPAANRCRICGSTETVRSHLFPRALHRDIRKDAKHVVGVKPGQERVSYLQSGEWSDRILCAAHEAQLGESDDYAIRFCRAFLDRGQPIGNGQAVRIANPQPRKLVVFAHAVVWRHAAAHKYLERSLGPYMDLIQAALFETGALLELIVVEPGHQHRGERTLLGVCPVVTRTQGVRCVRFDIGGLGFILKTDQRLFPYPLRLFKVDSDPTIILIMDPVEITQNRFFVDAARVRRT